MLGTKNSAQKFRKEMLDQGKVHHIHRIDKSHEIIERVISIYSRSKNVDSVINYLKKIDPYIFEELVLSVLEKKRIKIQRNTSYSGDGGIDGIFHTKKGRVLIQCKRYSNYINHQDVKELAENVKKGKYYAGLFVHTGSTGKASTTLSHYYKNVIFLQDENLVRFVVGEINIEPYLDKEYKDLLSKPTPDKKDLPHYKKKKGWSFPSFSLPKFSKFKFGCAAAVIGVSALHFTGVAPIPFKEIGYTVSNFPFKEIAIRLHDMYGDKK